VSRAYYNEIDPYAAEWLRNLIAVDLIAPGDVDTRSIEDVTPGDLLGYTQCHFFAGIGVWSHALRAAGWDDSRPVWTGSCPCQPFSAAGRGRGTADERHLWPAWFWLIEQCRPRVVFGEQVEAAIKHDWLDLVQTDLEGIGYATGAIGLPAAGVGAPHGRARLWFVADAGHGNEHDRCELAGATGEAPGEVRDQRLRADARHGGIVGELADDDGVGLRGRGAGETVSESRSVERLGRRSDVGELADREREGLEGHAWHGDERHQPGRVGADAAGSVAKGGGASFWSACDWLPCRDGKARPVEPGTFPLAHGVAARVGRLRAYGNAIVAPCAQEFIAAYMSLDRGP
jgi:DNA (cytosine-5)-methyltransferase 1